MARRRERYQHASLRKAVTSAGAVRPLPPQFHQHSTIGLMSADWPQHKLLIHGGHESLGRYMDSMGLKYFSTRGKYDNKAERSYIVLNPTLEQMKDLGHRFGQDSIVFSKGPHDHKLVYTNGEHTGKFRPYLGTYESFDTEPDDAHTYFPGHGFLRLHFDWDNAPLAHQEQKPEQPVSGPKANEPDEALGKSSKNRKRQLRGLTIGQERQRFRQYLHRLGFAARQGNQNRRGVGRSQRGLAYNPNIAKEERLKYESGAGAMAHPHAYAWHDGHTDHHAPASPVLRKDQPVPTEHPHTGGPPQENPHVNDQVAGVGVKTYAKFAQPYGTITPGKKTDLNHYPYQDKLPAIEKLVADHGFRTYFAGGKHGKPDLATKNYNTGHLMVYDPTPQSGGDFGNEDYTSGWRQIHELSHALTYPQLNSIYGEGRRIGRLGVHRTLRESLRAVHWEWLAAHKQRELSEKIGIHIPDETFNRELNTVLHDAVHRAVTGKFTEPSSEGFEPHPHKISLDHALGAVSAEAQRLGLTDHNSLIRKSVNLHAVEGDYTLSDKTFTIAEAKQELAKAVKAKIESYRQEMAGLRKRELRKSAAPAAAAQAGKFKVTVPDLANCPRCGHPDAPGSCTCLTKGESKTKLFAGAEHKGAKAPFAGAKSGANPLGKEESAAVRSCTCGQCSWCKSHGVKKADEIEKSGEAPHKGPPKKLTPAVTNDPKKLVADGSKEPVPAITKDEPSLFSGAEHQGKKPSLFERAKAGEDVLKDEPNMSLFSGTENKADKEPELFSGAKKGASPLGKEEKKDTKEVKCAGCGKPMNPVDVMVSSGRHICGACVRKQHQKVVGKVEPEDKSMAYSEKDPKGKRSFVSQDKMPVNDAKEQERRSTELAARRAKNEGVKKSESPIFKAMGAKNLCKTCHKSHQGPRCSDEPKVVKDEADFHKPTTPGVLPSDKKSKVIETPGSGGQTKPGMKKDETPAAKPPSGKNPTAMPASKPGTAPGMAAPAKPAKPATGAAPIVKGDFGFAGSGKVATSPAQAAAPTLPTPKKDASTIRGTPMGHIAVGRHAVLPGAHLFGKKPAAAPAVVPAPAPAAPKVATGTK